MGSVRFANHPFRFLLYLEWALLAIALVSLLTPAAPLADGPRHFQPVMPRFPLVSAASILGFGLLGLWLPTGRLPLRLGHLALQVGLIGITSVLGFAGGRLFPFMYLVLVIRSCFMFGLAGRIATSGVAFVLFWVALQLRVRLLTAGLPPRVLRRLWGFLTNTQLNLIFFFGLTLAFVLLLVNALMTERESQDRLRRANAELRRSAAELERLAMDQERSRIARDIHDSLGHSLTALNIQLEGALKLADRNPQQARAFLTEAKRMGSLALQDVRQSVAQLRGEALQGKSLEEAVAEVMANLQSAAGVVPSVRLDLAAPLPDPVQVALYRILQEGLTNILRHAQPSAVALELTSSEGQATLTLRDNGKGFNPAQLRSGYGLRGMRERAEALGGKFEANSQPGQGTVLRVRLPLQPVEV